MEKVLKSYPKSYFPLFSFIIERYATHLQNCHPQLRQELVGELSFIYLNLFSLLHKIGYISFLPEVFIHI